MKHLASALVAGLIQDHAQKDSSQESIERAYRELRRVRESIALTMNSDGEFWLFGDNVDEAASLATLLDQTGAERQLMRLKQTFERGGVRAILFLPDLALLEMEVAVGLIREGGEFIQLKLMERLVHRVMILNASPMLLVKRSVSDLVAAALDATFLTMTGIDRAGCGDEHGPDHVLSVHGKALLQLLDEPDEIASFLSSLDLVLHSYPAEVQRGVLRILAQAVPESEREACEQALEVMNDAPDEVEGVRKGVIASVLSSMRGQEVPELSLVRRPPRVRRIEGDTQPGPTLPMAIPPPLLPVEEVAERAQSAPNLGALKDDGIFAFRDPEESLPGVVLEASPSSALFGQSEESLPDQAMEDRVATYRERSNQLLARAAASTASEYPQCIHALSAVAEHLLDHGEYAEAWGVIRFLISEMKTASRSEAESREALEQARFGILAPTRSDALCEALPHADFPEQAAILEILKALGSSAMLAMLNLNASYYLGPTLRRSLFAVMETSGESGAEILADYLRGNKTRLHRLTPLVEILGTIDKGCQRELLITYSRHPVPAVRKSSLIGLYRSLGKEAEPILIDALRDEDPSVCQTAITLLATSRCMRSDFIDWIYQIIISPNPSDVREEGVLVAALRALGLLGNVPIGASGQVEDVLLDRLGVSKGGWLRRSPRLENDLSPRVQEALCSTLGSIGTDHSTQALELFLDDGLPAVRMRAQEALERIRSRGSMVV